ncbi:MAG: hypothetical protein GF411_18415 [Candidatus Lokiarchaeota archaeon]|nr:hypothetical protein [Candidatus Lokiarchaeota archaeon]
MAPQVTPVKALKMEYFPLSPGNFNEFNTTTDSETWMTKRYVADDWEFLGGPFGTFTIYWCEAHMYEDETDYTWVNQMWLSKTDDTVIWWGFEDANAKITVSQGLPYVREPVQNGTKLGGSSTGDLLVKESGQVIPNVPFKANYTIEALESVTVPKGTFENCIRIHEEEITPDGEISFWVWYAPNVGAVKYFYPDQENRTDVLVDYGVDLENDPWDAWFVPQLPTVLLITTIAIVAVVSVGVIFLVRKRNA